MTTDKRTSRQQQSTQSRAEPAFLAIDIFNLQEHLDRLEEIDAELETRREEAYRGYASLAQHAETAEEREVAAQNAPFFAPRPRSERTRSCDCDDFLRIGAYYDANGAITFHLKQGRGHYFAYPLYRQYLPEGEHGLQSVEVRPLNEENDRQGIERIISAAMSGAGKTVEIVWETDIAYHSTP